MWLEKQMFEVDSLAFSHLFFFFNVFFWLLTIYSVNIRQIFLLFPQLGCPTVLESCFPKFIWSTADLQPTFSVYSQTNVNILTVDWYLVLYWRGRGNKASAFLYTGVWLWTFPIFIFLTCIYRSSVFSGLLVPQLCWDFVTLITTFSVCVEVYSIACLTCGQNCYWWLGQC